MKYIFIVFLSTIQFIISIKNEYPRFNKYTLQSLTVSGYFNSVNNDIPDFSVEVYAEVRNIFSIDSKNVKLVVFNEQDLQKENDTFKFSKENIKKIYLINPKYKEVNVIQLTDIYVSHKSFHQILSHRVGPYLIENVFFRLKSFKFTGNFVLNVKSHFFIPPFLFQIIKKKHEIVETNQDTHFTDEISIFCKIKPTNLNEKKNYTCITYITTLKSSKNNGKGYICRCSDFFISPKNVFQKITNISDKIFEEEKTNFQEIFDVSKVKRDLKPVNFKYITNKVLHLVGKNFTSKLIFSDKHKEIYIYFVDKNLKNDFICGGIINNSKSFESRNCFLKNISNKYFELIVLSNNINYYTGIKIIYGYNNEQYFQTYKTFMVRVFKDLKEPRSLQFFFDDCHYIHRFLKENFDQHLKNVNSSLIIQINQKKIIHIYTNLDFESVKNSTLNVPSKVANALCGNINKTNKLDLSKIVQAKVLYKIILKENEGNLFKSYLMFEFNKISKEKFLSLKSYDTDDYFLAKIKKNNIHLWKRYLNLQKDNDKEEFIELSKSFSVWIWIWSILALWMLLAFFGLPIKNIFLMKSMREIWKVIRYTNN